MTPDTQFRRLLVAIDGSPSSQLALSLATSIAQREHGTLTLVAVSPAKVLEAAFAANAGVSPDTVQADADAAVQATLDAALAQVPAGIRATALLRNGNVGPTIVEVADQGDYDAIVMGARGLGRVSSAFGSVSEYVLHHAKTTTLVAHQAIDTQERDAKASGAAQPPAAAVTDSA
jgi:nucleotide-binding universal stress UspA family protein